LNGLTCAWYVFDVHQVEIYLLSRILLLCPEALKPEIKFVCLGRVSNPRGEGQLTKVVGRLGLNSFQLKPYLLVLALEVLIFFFSNNLALHRSIHRGLTLIQLLKGLIMLLLKLP
jgi:hypothetical protein